MTRPILFLTLFFQIRYSSSEFATATRTQSKPPCGNQNKNALIEHFFNTIFTEFYSTPPVCVCVQMCAGQSTYCYPNGCLKYNLQENEVKAESTQTPIVQKNKNRFMLLKGDRDFMTDFLERNYMDESREPPQSHNPVEDLRPDVFKKKYSAIGKYKISPNVNLRHHTQEKVKKDTLSAEGDLTKTRWPLNTQIWRSGRRTFSNIERPLINQGTYFAAMLHDNDGTVYPPKYFKRELAKTADDDEGNIKSFYHLENSLNVTEGKTFSLEMLIDNLIKSSFGTNIETTTNIAAIAKRDDAEIESKVPIENALSINSTGLANETTSVISMNFTNENVDKNKYLDTAQMKKTAKLNEMITILANRIEVENNTSMEIARRTITAFDEKSLKTFSDESTPLNITKDQLVINRLRNETIFENIKTTESTETMPHFKTETTTLHESKVTRKNRQRLIKKAASKINSHDINQI